MWRKNIFGSIMSQRMSSAAEVNNIMGRPLTPMKGGKDEKQIIKNFFNSGVRINPHPEKRYKGGEDAAAFTDRMISTADGVGGWAESGIDPALYSKGLCEWIYKIYNIAE